MQRDEVEAGVGELLFVVGFLVVLGLGAIIGVAGIIWCVGHAAAEAAHAVRGVRP